MLRETPMLRSRPTRLGQSEPSYWTQDLYPTTPTPPLTLGTPTQHNMDISWKELEESPKRLSLRRPYDNLLSSRRNFAKGRLRRYLPLLFAASCCAFLFWLLSPTLSFSNISRSYFYPFPIGSPADSQDPLSITSKPHQQLSINPSSPIEKSFSTPNLPSPHPPNIDNTDTRKVPWPPLITSIPETRPDLLSLSSGLTTSSIDSQFCGGVSPCRILMPLWIGEQESRSRMHLIQVLELARMLNRTLVLPNVGRSRIGACARWEFAVYYDVGSFVGKRDPEDDKKGLARKVMLMDDFRTWLEMRPAKPSGQLLFVDEKTDVDEDASSKTTTKISPNSTESLSLYIDKAPLDSEDPRLKKVKCLPTKYRQLELGNFSPITVHIPPVDSFGGQFLADAFTQEDTFTASRRSPSFTSTAGSSELPMEPEVLILHWDTRHFPFPHLLDPESMVLDYSSKLHALAHRLIPPNPLHTPSSPAPSIRIPRMPTPYLAIHWRMETVSPPLLPDCAEALVDTISSLLSDPGLGDGVKTVWFASDFPWPVSSGAAIAASPDALIDSEGPGGSVNAMAGDSGNSDSHSGAQQETMPIASSARRSNTFRSVSHQHIQAISIFTSAFLPGGVLENYKLTGESEELDRVRRETEAENKDGRGYVLEEDDDEGVLLEDSGVLGILDKLVARESTLFVSGAKRCGRVSSFTKQITDYRAKQKENAPRNVVDVFG